MAIDIAGVAARTAGVGSSVHGRICRRYPLRTAPLGRLPAAGNRSDREQGAHDDDGVAGAGLPLFKHCERLERKGASDAGWAAVEPGGSVQHDAAPHRGGAKAVLDGGVEEAATEIFPAQGTRGVVISWWEIRVVPCRTHGILSLSRHFRAGLSHPADSRLDSANFSHPGLFTSGQCFSN